jgi:hypothetical protein
VLFLVQTARDRNVLRIMLLVKLEISQSKARFTECWKYAMLSFQKWGNG